MRTEIVYKVVSAVHDSPKSMNQIAEAIGIGWGTREKCLDSLKLLGMVEETGMVRERLFSFRERRRGWLYPHASRIVGKRVERSDGAPA